MNLQEKIDKLPLSIEYNGKEYFLHIENRSISKLFEDVVDRALTIIENKEWEHTK